MPANASPLGPSPLVDFFFFCLRLSREYGEGEAVHQEEMSLCTGYTSCQNLDLALALRIQVVF